MRLIIKNVNSPNKEEMPFEVALDDTVAEVKREIQKRSAVDPAQMKFVFGGSQMNDEKKLKDFEGMVDGAMIRLVVVSLRPRNVVRFILHSYQVDLVFDDLDSNDANVARVKDMLAGRLMIDLKLVFLFRGQILEDEQALGHYGIVHGSEVQVELVMGM
jgi:hypothetical protein